MGEGVAKNLIFTKVHKIVQIYLFVQEKCSKFANFSPNIFMFRAFLAFSQNHLPAALFF